MSDWNINWDIIGDSSKEGGQGKVYKVKNKANGEYGALKILHESQTKISSRRSRFTKEVIALQLINNNSIPKVIDFNTDADNPMPYFVSEWIEGNDLNEFQTTHSFSIEEALKFTRELALIVDSCHQKGIIHRDIKPQNIRVKDGHPVLIDFGTCWTIDESTSVLSKTPLEEELGNRFLRLPELTAGSHEKHEKICDITFIVGILIFLVTGKSPRQLKDSNDKMPQERLSEEELVKLRKTPEWNKINRIFNIGFQQSFSLRFGSCIELIDAIDKVLENNETVSDMEDFEEYKKQLSDIINTDELKQRRNAVGQFKKLNDKLYKNVMNELNHDGTSVSNNESHTSFSHQKNMYIGNNMFPTAQIILSHNIEIVDNKIKCSYSIRKKQNESERQINYYTGYVTDIETLEESIDNYKLNFIKDALKEFLKQLK